MNVLIVDDKPENLYLLEAILKGDGHYAIKAEEGKSALEKLHDCNSKVDLIISDILMPGMDGFQLCRECKKDAALREIPFVFYTANYTDQRDEIFALNIGTDKFIIKPSEPDVFINIIRDVLAKKKPEGKASQTQSIGKEEEYLKEYSSHVVKKLEAKMLELQESEAKYRLVVDNANEAIIVIQDLKMVFVNLSCVAITGYPKEDLMSAPFKKFIHPDDNSMVTYQYLKTLNSGGLSKGLPFRIVCRDGAIKWVELSGPVISWDGRPATLNFISDITERRTAEEELRQTEERYRTIFENVQEGIFRTTPEGKIIMANPAMAKLFGFKSFSDMAKSLNFIDHQLHLGFDNPSDLEYLPEEFDFTRDYEVQQYRKDGKNIWVLFNMKPVRNKKGTIAYYDGIAEDITERKQKNEQIRNALQGTIRTLAVTIETRDPYTSGHQKKVADLALAIARELDLSDEQIEGLYMAALIHDIGKISIPAEILSKPSLLTEVEFGLIKNHPKAGHDILKNVEFPWPIARMIMEHHERVDGSGYPFGLTGEEVLLESRILTVADVVEAMASHRPYRPGLGIDFALKEIEKSRETLYDGTATDSCLTLFRDKGFQLS